MSKNLFQKFGKKVKKGTKVVDSGIKKGVKKVVPKKVRKTVSKGAKQYSKTYSKIDKSIYKRLGGRGSVLGESYKAGSYFNPLSSTKVLADVARGKTNIVRAGLNEFTPYGDYKNVKRFVTNMR